MAERAQELLAGSGWLPEPLRTSGRAITPMPAVQSGSLASSEDSASAGHETAMANSYSSAEDQPVATETPTVAAEERKQQCAHSLARRQRRAFFVSESTHVQPSL